ncbi:NUDIX hydrolase [Acetanaerobacterium elongatum]|uniref:8-oxo-dGTPase n=1 Tax=Acetanaerobacterium elongatum TaxID=258515 RepID=A0A1H0F643_9FIRM|nr:NUDIX domain-containing protein [Acetanaerobacterium elongatum]SDN90012.1 8-oxo-dGTPase [Acetanaerobacterium elongatum]
MLKVKFHEDYEDQLLKYAVIVSQYGDYWVFCKHKQRNTYECPGGHRKPGEDILTTAERELFEETGAISYTVREICPYSVTDTEQNVQTYGMLYFADIIRFSEMPDSEMERIVVTETLPEKWADPLIQPKLVEKVCSVVGAS